MKDGNRRVVILLLEKGAIIDAQDKVCHCNIRISGQTTTKLYIIHSFIPSAYRLPAISSGGLFYSSFCVGGQNSSDVGCKKGEEGSCYSTLQQRSKY